MSAPAGFDTLFENYLQNARAAQAQSQHHDYRRGLFLDFLGKAFDIQAEEIDVEKFLRIDVRRKGWVDALFRDLVFEFKRSLEVERADGLRELNDYLRTLPNGQECLGLLTDGLIFEVYALDGAAGKLQEAPLDTVDLGKMEAESAFLWLDSYLFSQKNARPTSADIVRRFGSQSPTFQAAGRILADLLGRVGNGTALTLKRKLWGDVLSKVYGSDVGSDDLFVRHTFLNQFAKLLAYASLAGIPRDSDVIAGIITGEAFQKFNVGNLGEIDFFAWMLDEAATRDEAIGLFKRLAQSLVVYDLKRVDEDLLKQLYQDLVDPETRHDLGEYYTPDWLAELTLKEIDYRPGQSLLDPSCGSGTFLFTAIRCLAQRGLTGWQLVDFALENIVGMDVHPLAVTVARINYLLAIIPHMRGQRTRPGMGLLPIPVYMADALLTPGEKGLEKNVLPLLVDKERDEKFRIPVDAASAPGAFNEIVELMDEYARRPIAELNMGLARTFLERVQATFPPVASGIGADVGPAIWGRNLTLLNRLIHEGRNSIWAYVLKNQARPLLLAAQKFDVIAGNPPWLSYRYIKNKTYQAEVKSLTLRHGLLQSDEAVQFPNMDLSTLFMAHCEATYLREGGLIAFVMPRSTITGAKQHRAFQARGLTRVLDLRYVEPLFNVESAVLIRRPGDTQAESIPSLRFSGHLPAHQIQLSQANEHLTIEEGTTHFLGQVTVAGSYYYDQFRKGSDLLPRNLCFVKPQQPLQPGDAAVNPSMETDPDVDKEAKAPWKGIRLQGLVFGANLFATLLSKNLMPFGWRKLHMVALPVRLNGDGRLAIMDENDFLQAGQSRSWNTWFAAAERKWAELRKGTSQFVNLIDQYNYRQKLTMQRLSGNYKTLYNLNGTHISACVVDIRGEPPKVYEYPTQGFVADYKTYYCETENADEAHFLCALLNAPCVDKAIKSYQTRGIYKGERDISRTPFEACAIPPFDANNADHMALARLSLEAHERVKNTPLTGQVVKARSQARAAVESQIAQIDGIARRVLGL